MAIQAETIVSGLVSAWQADKTLGTLVPGGLWYGQAPQDETVVRAIISFEATGDTIKTATREYLQSFEVTLKLYATKTMTSADWQNIREQINATWCGVVSPAVVGASLVSFEPDSASVELAPERRDGEDVLVGSATFSGLAQGVF